MDVLKPKHDVMQDCLEVGVGVGVGVGRLVVELFLCCEHVSVLIAASLRFYFGERSCCFDDVEGMNGFVELTIVLLYNEHTKLLRW